MFDHVPGIRWYNAGSVNPADMRIRAVLFDLDGTVIDTEKLYVRFWAEAATVLGFPMTREQALNMRSLNVAAGSARMREMLGEQVVYEEVRDKRKELMNAFIEQEGIEPKPGIREILAYLRANGVKAAIVTASPVDRATEHLALAGLSADLFDRIISARMVAHGKPEPDVYLFAAAELGLKPEECIAVEDSPTGLLSAYRAGCHPVLVPDLDAESDETKAILLASCDSLDRIAALMDGLGLPNRLTGGISMPRNGIVVCNLAPGGDYTRHSEGSFLRLKNGRILFVYSRFTGSADDGAPSDLVALESADEGASWSEPRIVVPASHFGVQNVMSVTLMRMADDSIGLFFIVKLASGWSDIVLGRSYDEGVTFGGFVVCSDAVEKSYYVLNNDRVIRLKTGRIVIPLARHDVRMEGGRAIYNPVSKACFIYSDDDGATWHASPSVICAPFADTETGLQENGLVELRDGTLWGYSRTDQGCHYEYFSHDGGLHWTDARPSAFTAPVSPLTIVRHPVTKALHAVWNPVPLTPGKPVPKAGWGRTPLVCAVSADEGKTWSEPLILEDDPEHGYCYPGVFFTGDGCMLVSYCSGGPNEGVCLAKTTILKVKL